MNPIWSRHRGPAWLLVLLVLVVFGRALFGDLVYDDVLNFQRNVALREGDLWALCTRPFFRDHLPYWRPVASLVMAFGYRAGGLLGVHAVSLAVHAAAAILVQRLAFRVFGDHRAALATAVLFALHPVQVESIAWASALAEPLCALLVLSTIAAALRWRDAERTSLPWPMAVFLLLSLLTKENGLMVVPLLPLVLVVLPGPKVRWWALSAMIAVATVTWVVLRAVVLEHPFGSANANDAAFHLASWAAGCIAMIAGELQLLLLPFPLHPFHTMWAADSMGAQVAWDWALVGSVIVGVGVWRRNAAPLRLALCLLLVPLLLPVLQHQALGQYPIAERYLYLPASGLALGLVALVRRRLLLLVIPAIACAVLSFTQCRVWRDQGTFIAHGLAVEPFDCTVQILAGDFDSEAAQVGDHAALERARREYGSVLDALVGSTNAADRELLAKARIGLAWSELLVQQRTRKVDPEHLAALFRRAIACDGAVAGGWVGLGVAHALAGHYDAASEALHRAIKLDERCPEAWYNLGNLQFERGQLDAARASLQQALRCNPDLAVAAELLSRLR